MRLEVTNFPDWAYKTFWTAVASALGCLTAGPTLFDVPALKAAGMAAVTSVATALLAYARERAA